MYSTVHLLSPILSVPILSFYFSTLQEGECYFFFILGMYSIFMKNNIYVFMKMQAANIYFSLPFPLIARDTLGNKGEEG